MCDFVGRLILGLAVLAVAVSVAETSSFRLPAGVAATVLVALLIGAIAGRKEGMGGLVRLLGVCALAYMFLTRLGVVAGLGHLVVFVLLFGAFYVMLRPLLRRE